MAEKIISKYLRDKHTNKRRGVVVAVSNDTAWAIGVSVTNVKAGDSFDADLGFRMAKGRAEKALNAWQYHKNLAEDKKVVQTVTDELKVVDYLPTVEVPVSVYDEVREFSNRSHKYFKDKLGVCSLEANTTRMNFNESVEELTALFETDGQSLVPPSQRITAEEIQQLQRVAQALNVLTQGNMNRKRVSKT